MTAEAVTCLPGIIAQNPTKCNRLWGKSRENGESPPGGDPEGKESSGVFGHHGSHGFKLLFHVLHQLELGAAAVQILLRVVDAEVVVAV